MLKKAIAIPLFILYFVAMSGMMVQMHFCGDQLASWQISEKQASCCCDSSEGQSTSTVSVNNNDCCQNKSITLKIHDAQQQAQQIVLNLFEIQTGSIPTILHHAFIQSTFVCEPILNTYWANPPPDSRQLIPLYKLHHNYTYYG